MLQTDSSYVSDTNWKLISTTFIATGEENYTQIFLYNLNPHQIYYYIFDDLNLTEANNSILKSIKFDNNQYLINNLDRDNLSKFIKSFVNIEKIELIGYADEQGKDQENLDLSMKRCYEIKIFLKTIKPHLNIRIIPKGERESQGKTLQDYRRVDLKVSYSGLIQSSSKNVKLDSSLMTKLENLQFSDQFFRAKYDSIFRCCNTTQSQILKEIEKNMQFVDSLNLVAVNEIITIYGYPGLFKVSPDYMNTIALLILHSDSISMEKYVEIIKNQSERFEVSPWCYAYLVDHIKLNKNEPQIYGSQLKFNKTKKMFEPFPIENSKGVNARRYLMGMNTIEKYLESFNGPAKKPNTQINRK